LRLHATISYLQLHLDIFATISCVDHICEYTITNLRLHYNWFATILMFILTCEQHFVWFSLKKNNLCPISCKIDQFSYNPMNIQRCILWILKIVIGCIRIYKCIWTTILHVYSDIIISINGLNIMVTLISVYFEYIKILCKIFTKYIVPILQVYPHHLIILLQIITYYIYYYLYNII
jgi:hypothetical protein